MAYKLVPESKKSSPQQSLEGLKEQVGYRLPGEELPGQIAKEGASLIAGLPGDVFNLLNTFVAKPATEAITGKEGVPYEETYLGKIFPTSAQHRENLEKIPILKPKGKFQEMVNEISGDALSLLLPIKTKSPFRMSPQKALYTSIGANIAGESVSDLTGDEKKGAFTKMGALFGLSLINKPAAAKHVGELYKKAEGMRPANAKTNAVVLGREMNELKQKILSGRRVSDLAPSEKFVVEEADKVLGNISNGGVGDINISTLTSLKRSLNEQLTNVMTQLPDKAAKQRAKKLATEINHSLRKQMQVYGKTNPEWLKVQTAADEGFGTIAQSNFFTRFIENNLKYHPVTSGLLHILGASVGAAGAIAPYQAVKLLFRIKNSPTLAKYYGSTLKAAAAEDAEVFNKEMAKLDHELQKDQKKRNKKYRLVD